MNQEKSKILIFSTAFHPFVGGAEVAIKEITDRLSDFEFHMITARLDKSLPKCEKIGSITVHRIGFGIPVVDKLMLPKFGALKTLSLKRKHNFKAFWSVMVTYASWSAFFTNLVSFKKVPVILTLQEGDSEQYLKTKWFGLINFSWRIILKGTTIVTAISSYLADRAIKFGFKGEIKLVPNGVDVTSFSRDVSKEIIQNTREGLGLKKDDVALVTASRLNEKNGIGDVINSLEFLPENVKFFVFGDGELKADLIALAKLKNVSDRVVFKGFVSHEELPVYLKSCDIFIRPSLSEGFGNSFVEAMASGIPCIATPVGGIPDFLKDEETGIFCEVSNPQSIADAVMKLVNNPDLVSKIKQQAFEMVKEKYDWNLVAKEMSNIFKSL